MTALILLRHGPTAWNAQGRMQGRADIPLSDDGRAILGRRKLPAAFEVHRALSSPLRRCIETAALLGLSVYQDARLAEMHWGAYEGFTLAELRAAHGVAFTRNEARGLDFRPPGGESPREVQGRVAPLLAEIAATGRPALAVTHRGVIRAVYAQAVAWDMTGPPPHDLDPLALQVLILAHDGSPRLDRVNVALEPR